MGVRGVVALTALVLSLVATACTDKSSPTTTAGGATAVNSVTSTSSSSASTYVDESGFIWYETDCPDAAVVLLAGADGLPPKEATEREPVEGYAERNPEYRVIPRNGWVWERLDDGSVSVIQVEDYMLERTIESADQCPGGPVYVGIPVAYRISDD